MSRSLRLYLPIAILIVLALSAAAYFSWIGDYLGASLLGPDIGSTYVPLVRHAGSFHCYDDGSNFCEERFSPGFQKEFTLGYVASTAPRIPNTALYSCAGPSQTAGEGYVVTTNKDECTDKNLRPYRLGFIFTGSEPAIEAPTKLYRCSKGTDILLTDDAQDCTLGEYGTAEPLGYVASAGYLPSNRLAQSCAIAAARCTQSQDIAFCNALTPFCEGIPQREAGSAVLSANIQEQARPLLDVDQDGTILPEEVTVAVNSAIDRIGQTVTEATSGFHLVQTTNQTTPSATGTCFVNPTLNGERGATAQVACDSGACNQGPCLNGQGAGTNGATCSNDPGPTGFAVQVPCDSAECKLGPCTSGEIKPTPTSITSCPAGSAMVCPACAAGTPPEKCQCACSPGQTTPTTPNCPSGQQPVPVGQTSSIPPSIMYECQVPVPTRPVITAADVTALQTAGQALQQTPPGVSAATSGMCPADSNLITCPRDAATCNQFGYQGQYGSFCVNPRLIGFDQASGGSQAIRFGGTVASSPAPTSSGQPGATPQPSGSTSLWDRWTKWSCPADASPQDCWNALVTNKKNSTGGLSEPTTWFKKDCKVTTLSLDGKTYNGTFGAGDCQVRSEPVNFYANSSYKSLYTDVYSLALRTGDKVRITFNPANQDRFQTTNLSWRVWTKEWNVGPLGSGQSTANTYVLQAPEDGTYFVSAAGREQLTTYTVKAERY